jgi:hypothetical protein
MSPENIEIVRRAFDNRNAFLWGELASEAFSELIDPQIGGTGMTYRPSRTPHRIFAAPWR